MKEIDRDLNYGIIEQHFLKESVKEVIKQIRLANNLSQNDFAKQMGVSTQYIIKLECGSLPVTETISSKLLYIFGITKKIYDKICTAQVDEKLPKKESLSVDDASKLYLAMIFQNKDDKNYVFHIEQIEDAIQTSLMALKYQNFYNLPAYQIVGIAKTREEAHKILDRFEFLRD